MHDQGEPIVEVKKTRVWLVQDDGMFRCHRCDELVELATIHISCQATILRHREEKHKGEPDLYCYQCYALPLINGFAVCTTCWPAVKQFVLGDGEVEMAENIEQRA